MTKRSYYSMRTGQNPSITLDLAMLRKLFLNAYLSFDTQYFFQEAFGYQCVDVGVVPGTLGTDVGAEMLRRLHKDDLWPIEDKCAQYSEDDLFDVMEFLNDCVSQPVQGRYHSFGDCGWHYHTFDREAGRDEFRTEMNDLLGDYQGRYQMSADGEIMIRPESGLEHLVIAELPACDPDSVEHKVETAIRKFLRYASSMEDRRDAIRDLADVLEFLRPEAKQVLTRKDEADLFNIANNFGIRHHNVEQKTDYDASIWYEWMFYYYLATIHAVLRLLQRSGQDNQ